MRKNLSIIILSVFLVLAVVGDVILFKSLLEEKERNETLQATVSELQAKNNELNTLHTELATANETIADLEAKVEEITAEMLENLSVELNEEQQEANETAQNPDNNSGNTNNNNGGNTQPQQPPQTPDIDLSYFQGEGFSIGEGPTLREPEHEFGDHDPSLTGGRAQ